MNFFRVLWKVPVLLALLLLAGCGDSWSWHQKLTVTVDTPSGPKSASSVMKATLTRRDGPLTPREASGAFFDLEGEAISLEVLPGKYLFVLLKNMPRPYWLFFPDKGEPVDIAPILESTSKPLTATLARSDYPLLVTFTDINDPKTVKRVNPGNLAEFLGPGTTLTSITLSITNERVTEGKIEDVLGWLRKEGEENPTLLPNPPYLRKNATDPDIQYLTVSSFSTELYK